jgi:hypothetical protein
MRPIFEAAPTPEAVSARMEQALDVAEKNPIAESRLGELEQEISRHKKDFVERGTRSAEDEAREEEILEEILQSSAVADTIVEYKLMLESIARRHNLPDGWSTHMLAHENAHANVAISTGHEFVGYAAIHMKDESGALSSIQPLVFHKPDPVWGPVESLKKGIEVTKAPEAFENEMSDDDIASVAEDEEHLARAQQLETQRQLRLSEIRGELAEID